MNDAAQTTARTGRVWRAAFALALLFQIWALYTPRPPHVESAGLPLDKITHVLLFAAVTWLGVRAGIPPRWAAVAMVAQACLSELVQLYLLPSRGGEWGDLAADVVGITVGLLLARDRSHTRDYLPDSE